MPHCNWPAKEVSDSQTSVSEPENNEASVTLTLQFGAIQKAVDLADSFETLRFLHFQKPYFGSFSASIAREIPGFGHNPMARNHNAKRVETVGCADGSNRIRPFQFMGLIGITPGGAIGNLEKRIPNRVLKICSAHGNGKSEMFALASKVFIQLHIRSTEDIVKSIDCLTSWL